MANQALISLGKISLLHCSYLPQKQEELRIILDIQIVCSNGILLNIQTDEADWLLSNALGVSGLERWNVPAAGVRLDCLYYMSSCPLGWGRGEGG